MAHNLYAGNSGQDARETLWAAYNGVTECVDHWRDRGRRPHMDAVCFGRGFQIKARAFHEAMRIVAPDLAN